MYQIVSRRYNFQRIWEYISGAPPNLLYTIKLRSVNKGKKTFMEVRIKEGYDVIKIPTNQENQQQGKAAFRLKTRDSKWITYIGNPVLGMRGLVSSGDIT